MTLQGIYTLSFKTTYLQISWSLEAADIWQVKMAAIFQTTFW